MDYFTKLAFKSMGKLFYSCILCAANIQCPYIDTALSGYQVRSLLRRVLMIHFLCLEKFTLDQGRIQIRDLMIFSQTRYHRTNEPVMSQGPFTSFGEGALAVFVGKICAIFAFLGKYVNRSPIMS